MSDRERTFNLHNSEFGFKLHVQDCKMSLLDYKR